MSPAPRALRRLPLVGQSIGRIGQVYDILQTPCATTPEVWFLAFWNGVPKLVWSFVKPDPLDWAGERFGRGHGRRRKRKFKADGMMGSKVPVGRGLGWAAFSMYQLQQRVGFYLLLIDAGSEFVLNWTSTAYTWSGCHVGGYPYAEMERTIPDLWFSDGRWAPVDVYHVRSKDMITGTGSQIAVPPNVEATFHATVSSDPDPTWNGRILATRIRELESDKVVASSGDPSAPTGALGHSLAHRDYFPRPNWRTFSFEYMAEPGKYGKSNYASFAAYGKHREGEGLIPDP